MTKSKRAGRWRVSELNGITVSETRTLPCAASSGVYPICVKRGSTALPLIDYARWPVVTPIKARVGVRFISSMTTRFLTQSRGVFFMVGV